MHVACYQRQVVQHPFVVNVAVPEAYRALANSPAATTLNQNALGSMEDIFGSRLSRNNGEIHGGQAGPRKFFWPSGCILSWPILRHIAHTIEKDTDRYQQQIIQNPFMIDVVVLEAYRPHSTSPAAAAASTQNTLGSMEDILKLVWGPWSQQLHILVS